MRGGGHAKRSEKIVQLTIEVDTKDVLLSDFDLFHYVLNYWYLPVAEKGDKEFEKEYTELGFGWHDLKDFDIQTQGMKISGQKFRRVGIVFLTWNVKMKI